MLLFFGFKIEGEKENVHDFETQTKVGRAQSASLAAAALFLLFMTPPHQDACSPRRACEGARARVRDRVQQKGPTRKPKDQDARAFLGESRRFEAPAVAGRRRQNKSKRCVRVRARARISRSTIE
jgi:hypothetical protein